MTLNVDAVHNFGTVLRAIPFDTLTIHDFYHSIQSFYIGLLKHFMKKYGKNNPFVVNIAHTFEHFLQTCDFIEPLRGGIGHFTNMMASIIRDVYHIDLDLNDLKVASCEMDEAPVDSMPYKGEGSATCNKPAFNCDEMKEVLRNMHEQHVLKKECKENACYEAKFDRILSR